MDCSYTTRNDEQGHGSGHGRAGTGAPRWAQNVYRFGCAVIHLSSVHDCGANDPFVLLPETDRRWITDYLQKYHGASVTTASSFEQVTDYAPAVLKKISTNLEFELERLEASSGL